MSYPIISLHSFQKYISDYRGGSAIISKPEFVLRGEGDDLYQKIRQNILTILDSWKKQIKTIGIDKIKKEALEAELSADLFRVLEQMPMTALTDSDFWRFLACHQFFDFIEWRDGSDCALASFGADANKVNYDCVPYRMFNRALVVYGISDNINDLDYVKVPGTDLWRSHILRIFISYSSTMTQSILDKALAKALPTSILREIIKPLTRYRSNIIYETLDYDQAMLMLDAEIKKARAKTQK